MPANETTSQVQGTPESGQMLNESASITSTDPGAVVHPGPPPTASQMLDSEDVLGFLIT